MQFNINITPPVRVARTAVYTAIYDADDNLVSFIGMSDKADANAAFMVKLINNALEDT